MDYSNSVKLPAGYLIRDYSGADYAAVEKLWLETGLGSSARGDNQQIIQDTIDAGGHLLLVIADDESIIGTSWLTNDKRRTYLHHFGIDEKYRRRGLARALLQVSLQVARADGYQVKIEVHRENIPALNLYQKAAFGYLGDYDVYIIRDLNLI